MNKKERDDYVLKLSQMLFEDGAMLPPTSKPPTTVATLDMTLMDYAIKMQKLNEQITKLEEEDESK